MRTFSLSVPIKVVCGMRPSTPDCLASARVRGPDPVKPWFVFGFHEDRAEAGNPVARAGLRRIAGRPKPVFWRLYKGQVQIPFSARRKDLLRAARRLLPGLT